VPSQQVQGQLQTQHSVDTGNYIMDKHNINTKTNYRQTLEENTIMQTEHRVDTGNYIMDKHNIKSKTNCRQVLEEKRINSYEETNKQNNNHNFSITNLICY
jgi:hypothetical protein